MGEVDGGTNQLIENANNIMLYKLVDSLGIHSESVHHCERLLDDVLAFARTESTKRRVHS